LVIEKATGLMIRAYLDVTNSKEKKLPDVIEHYVWILRNRKKAAILCRNSHLFGSMRYWLKINNLNKQYVNEFIDIVML